MLEKQNDPKLDAERALRIRENKRRHRVRQKEYVSSLERKLAETREQSVQATKEVQVAAQRIVHENTRLRELLRLNGIGNEAIDAWVRQDYGQCGGQDLYPPAGRLGRNTGCKKDSTCSSMAKNTTTGICRIQTTKCNNSSDATTSQAVATSTNACQTRSCSMGLSANADTPTKSPTIPKNQTVHESEQFSTECRSSKLSSDISADSPASREPITSPQTEPEIAPCRLLTLLAKNPAADITQVPLSTRSEEERCNSVNNADGSLDGVECSAAYKLLMQYATSEEKMDHIAKALEEGCTPTQEGGCKVKKKVVWEVLDGVCG